LTGARSRIRQTERAVRVAVVDIGTNSTRLLIIDVDGGRVTAEHDRRSTVTRLGAGVDANGHLAEESIERVYRTLDEYKTMIENRHADRRIAVLTSAVRDAANGSEFASSVRERYGLEPHVLSGDDEAQLTFLGATSERDPHDQTSKLVIDIGGGSTELVIGSGRTARFHVSTQAGVVRQTERHLHHDPPRDDEIEELSDEVRGIVVEAVPEERREAVEHGIAVAGTATSLAAIAQGLEPYDPRKVHGHVLEVPEITAIRDRLAAIPLEERRQVRGLHPDRAPTIVAGVVILLEVIDLFGLGQIEVSEHDILRGAALGLGGGPS
jgi:exopolyphosphatase/guanosine-5'-triphosphate,3'-diphosphate pyrophosphatase